MKVGELCNREVVYIRSNETPLEAAYIMRDNHVGSVVIIDEEGGALIPKGVLTDRDITIEIVAQQVSPTEITVADITRIPLITISEESDASESLELMKQKGVRRAPVINADGALVGILSVDDFLEFFAEQADNIVSLFKKQFENEKTRVS